MRRGVDVRAPLQQGLDEVLVAVLRADDQRRRALVVHGPQVVLERRRHRPIHDGVRRGVALPIKGQQLEEHGHVLARAVALVLVLVLDRRRPRGSDRRDHLPLLDDVRHVDAELLGHLPQFADGPFRGVDLFGRRRRGDDAHVVVVRIRTEICRRRVGVAVVLLVADLGLVGREPVRRRRGPVSVLSVGLRQWAYPEANGLGAGVGDAAGVSCNHRGGGLASAAGVS